MQNKNSGLNVRGRTPLADTQARIIAIYRILKERTNPNEPFTVYDVQQELLSLNARTGANVSTRRQTLQNDLNALVKGGLAKSVTGRRSAGGVNPGAKRYFVPSALSEGEALLFAEGINSSDGVPKSVTEALIQKLAGFNGQAAAQIFTAAGSGDGIKCADNGFMQTLEEVVSAVKGNGSYPYLIDVDYLSDGVEEIKNCIPLKIYARCGYYYLAVYQSIEGSNGMPRRELRIDKICAVRKKRIIEKGETAFFGLGRRGGRESKRTIWLKVDKGYERELRESLGRIESRMIENDPAHSIVKVKVRLTKELVWKIIAMGDKASFYLPDRYSAEAQYNVGVYDDTKEAIQTAKRLLAAASKIYLPKINTEEE